MVSVLSALWTGDVDRPVRGSFDSAFLGRPHIALLKDLNQDHRCMAVCKLITNPSPHCAVCPVRTLWHLLSFPGRIRQEAGERLHVSRAGEASDSSLGMMVIKGFGCPWFLPARWAFLRFSLLGCSYSVHVDWVP